ncbi:MAG TPA: sensor histidine kinase [Caulobacteraceae bacterium]
MRAPRRGSSLVRRLVVLAAGWSLAVLIAAGIALSVYFNHAASVRLDDDLTGSVDGLVAGARAEAGVITPPDDPDPLYRRAYSGAYWEVATPDGAGGLRALSRSRSLWDRALPAPPGGLAALARTQGKGVFYDSPGPLDQPLRIDAMQVRMADYSAPVVFMAAEDRTSVNRDIRTFITTLVAALGILGAGLVAAVILQVRVGLRPLFALRREVADVRTGRRERLVGAYPTELAPLASELNALVEHNQQVVERQRTHVGNLAHALKTPLSVILAEAGQQGGESAGLVERQARIMSQQVDHHLRRARAAARTPGIGERTEVGPVVEELARTLERIFEGKVAHIDFSCPDNLWFMGERQDLLEMAGNAMENACKWCARRVRVSCAPSPGPSRMLRLVVEDDGEGLPAEQREAVLRRGERADESAPGSGLGLSIIDELARAYGGGVALGSSPLGGLSVEITLPRAER